MSADAIAQLLGVVLVAVLLVLVARVGLRARRRPPPAVLSDAPPLIVEAETLIAEAAHPPSPLVVLERPKATRFPIVLAHGYFGFEAIGLSVLRREYFRGVKARLEALGHTVHVARVSPAGSIELRAWQLARQIESLGYDKVNIIAHSMGGLDARYAIAHYGLGPGVASLTTVGTPHRGTPLADRAFLLGEWRRLRGALSRLGANIDGLYDLTTRRMSAFNKAVLDAANVTYASVIGAAGSAGSRVNRLLAPGHAYLSKVAGPNDGIVPAESQRWGEVIDEVDADHWAQIGWSGNFDAVRLYVMVAEELAKRGL
jgi:triacylglycerol lipase